MDSDSSFNGTEDTDFTKTATVACRGAHLMRAHVRLPKPKHYSMLDQEFHSFRKWHTEHSRGTDDDHPSRLPLCC